MEVSGVAVRILLKSIVKKYGNRVVLSIDRLELEGSRIYAVIGPNGSGKSTLLKIIAGVDREFEGQLSFGKEGAYYEDLVYLPQKPYMFDLTVLQNVLLSINGQNDASKKAMEVLDHVGMKNFSHAKMSSLSGGESQRVALARTLVCGCDIILLDEPASMVDVSSLKHIEKSIKEASKRDSSLILFSTHNPSQALRLADEVIILCNGEIIEHGNPSKVLKNPEKEETIRFLEDWRL